MLIQFPRRGTNPSVFGRSSRRWSSALQWSCGNRRWEGASAECVFL